MKLNLEAAIRAIAPFNVDVENGGVRRYIFDKYVYFEEYPTEKPTHILNGFIFALLGLYELSQITGEINACNLYEEGIASLHHTIAMYDQGNISSYDLTHLTIPGNSSKFHYGYHLTHIKQLSAICLFEADEILEKVKQRWLTYANGNQSCFRLKEDRLSVSANGLVDFYYLVKGKINRLEIQYDLDEEMQYSCEHSEARK